MSTEGRNGGGKTGGRQKGTPNKSRSEVKELLDKVVDFEVVFKKLFSLVNCKQPDPQAAKILLEYRYGKPVQGIEFGDEANSEVTIKISKHK